MSQRWFPHFCPEQMKVLCLHSLWSFVVVVQLLFVTLWTAARQDSLSFTIPWSLLKLMSIVWWPPSHLILCCPLLLLPSIFPNVRVFSNESALRIRLPKYWSFSVRISPSNEYSGLISFRIDCFDLLAVQGTLKNLLQHHCLKVSVLQRSANSHIRTWVLKNHHFDYTDLCQQSAGFP